jgi:hypothetical protein
MKYRVKLLAWCEKWVEVEAENEKAAREEALYGPSIEESNWEFVDEMGVDEVEEVEED